MTMHVPWLPSIAELFQSSGVAYCSPEHQQQDWTPSHKADCRLSRNRRRDKLPSWTHQDPADPASPIVKVLIPLIARGPFDHIDVNEEDASKDSRPKTFVNYQNPIDRLKPASRSSQRSDCRKTIYGPGERFLVRARWGGHADTMYGITEEDRRTGRYRDRTESMVQYHLG